MKKHFLLLSACVFILVLALILIRRGDHSAESAASEKAADFSLWDQNGVAFQLRENIDRKGIVLISYGIGCPISRRLISEVHDLRHEFKDKGVDFYFLDPNKLDGREKLRAEVSDYKIDIPVLMDTAQLVTQSFQIDRTATAILIRTKDWRIIYRGAVTDSLTYEVPEKAQGTPFLKEAITDMLKNRKVRTPRSEVSGCLYDLSPEQANPTYDKDVVPILKNRCLSCHYVDGPAPWAMTDYAAVKAWSPMILEVIRTKRMPPYQFDPFYPTMKGNYLMPDREVRILTDWINQGLQREDGKADLLPQWEEEQRTLRWPWGEPDMIYRIDEPQIVPARNLLERQDDIYSNVFPEDVWVKGSYIRPTNPSVVHHVSIYAGIPDNEEDFRKFSLSHGIPGSFNVKTGVQQDSPYRDKGFSNLEKMPENTKRKGIKEPLDRTHHLYNQALGYYVAGYHSEMAPAGHGWYVSAGSSLLVLAHYKNTGKVDATRYEIGFYFYPKHTSGIQQVYLDVIQGNDFRVPAGDSNYEYRIRYPVTEDIIMFGASPHGHYGLRSAKMSVKFPGSNEEKILFSVPRFNYDFMVADNRFIEPISIPAGSEIVYEGIIDNSRRNLRNLNPEKDKEFGWQQDEEMFWGVFSYGLDEKTSAE